ncbi:sugar transferase [Rothia sp. CCM 9417]|uniref:sugar transferase n=1 Tax=unclassified Rothia (in: high G+C Gram-positive bacteria) TaxID=2689056 RepID=UPI003AC4519A
MNDQRIEARWEETRNRRTWHPKIRIALYLADIVAISITFAIAHVASFGFANSGVMGRKELPWGYIATGVVFGIIWFLALSVANSRNIRYLGQGNDEYRLVTKATSYFFALIAIFSYLTKIDFARTYVILAYPIGLLLLLCARWSVRRWLVHWRNRGRALSRVMIIGDVASGNHLLKTLEGARTSGLSPVAAYLPRLSPGTRLDDENLPVLGYSPDPAEVLQVVRDNNIHAVAVSTGHGLNPTELRRLGWALAAAHVALIMAPALTDIAGPRIHTQPLNGVPLIHVHTPRIDGAKAIVKRSIDVFASAFGLIVLAPLLVSIALLVKSDGGPIFFLQERVGIKGTSFHMIKFRSMVPNAEELKDQLIDKNEGNGVLFKMADDPRITKIGKFIRKYSIDELPQLWNVLIGDMSLVGPRPPLPAEVEQYEEDAYRRLLVKPGITGLWQVSGRSNLSWEESIRLDLYYVENWSVIGDFVILFRTVRAVFAKEGAY